MRQTLTILLFLFSVCLCAQTAADTVSLLFAGDAMSHTVQVRWARTPEGLDYSPCVEEVKPYLSNADSCIVNLETPIAGAPYTGFPRFSAPDEYLDGLADAGFDLYLLANNHVVDQGGRGLSQTIGKLQQRNLTFSGAYPNEESRSCQYPAYKTFVNDIDSLVIAVFNCTYGTNDLRVPSPFVVNRIDTAEIRSDIEEAGKHADIKILCIHWGVEYQQNASSPQKRLAEWLAEAGFDLIIGSHPHVIQEYEVITTSDNRQVPVFYSLGNLLSNQRWRRCNGGIMAQIRLHLTEKKIVGVSYIPLYVHKGSWKGVKQYHLLPTAQLIDTLDRVDIPRWDRDSLRVFHNDTQQKLQNIAITSHF